MNVAQIIGHSQCNDYRQVRIVIGGDAEEYDSTKPHFDVSVSVYDANQVRLLLPESVAEHFRREGRRQLQSELRSLLNSARA